MTDTNIVDAVVFPQDDGTGVPDGQESYDSAGSFSLLSRYKGQGTYVGEDKNGNATLQFNDVDTGSNEFDIGAGHAYILDSKTIQSGAQTTYNTDLPDDTPYVVILPNEQTNLGLDSGINDVYLSLDPTANDSVTVRHGSGVSAPSDPSVKLGTVDASSGDTTRANDLANITTSSVTTGQQSVTGNVVRVAGVDENGNKVTQDDRNLANFSDIGALLNDINNTVKNSSVENVDVKCPPGKFQFSTNVVFDQHISLRGAGRPNGWKDVDSGNFDATTVLEFTGTGDGITFRGTADSPQTNTINVGSVERLALVPDTDKSGGSAIVLDGTTQTNSNGSIVRGILINDVATHNWGQNGVLGQGNVFDIDFENHSARANGNAGVAGQDPASSTGGQPPSQWTAKAPLWFATDTGQFSAKIRSNELAVMGGHIQAANGADGLKFIGGRGSLTGVHIEGSKAAGSRGVIYSGGGQFPISGGTVQGFDTGITIGDPANTGQQARGCKVKTALNSNQTEDVKILGGGQRNETEIHKTKNITVTDNRLANGNEQQQLPVFTEFGGSKSRVGTVSFAVDSTGTKTDTVFPAHRGSTDFCIPAPAGTDDGSGGSVTDFSLEGPHISDTSRSGGVDVRVEVTSASSTSGATASYRFLFMSMNI
jgi:hypothetical protein